jgi:2'-5' RNA ligase
MLALVPVTSDWCHIDLPHLTLVYAGKVSDLEPEQAGDLVRDMLDLSRRFETISLDVLGADVFGDDKDGRVDVLRLQATTPLILMRGFVEHWNASKHPFNPHVTVGPVGSLSGNIPNRIRFHKLLAQWGERSITTPFAPSVSQAG